MPGMAVRPLQAAVAGTLAVDNNKSACCALGGAARPPRAIDILTTSKVLASTTSTQVCASAHATQPTPCPISVILFAAQTSTSSGAAILHHGPAWGSLAAFFNKFFDSTTRDQQASYTRLWARLQQQSLRAFDSTRQNGAADRRSQIELMHVLVRTFVCV